MWSLLYLNGFGWSLRWNVCNPWNKAVLVAHKFHACVRAEGTCKKFPSVLGTVGCVGDCLNYNVTLDMCLVGLSVSIPLIGVDF
jgi:hypothetical protein